MKNLGIDLQKVVSGMCSFRGQRIIMVTDTEQSVVARDVKKKSVL
jgi:hypothetical protein